MAQKKYARFAMPAVLAGAESGETNMVTPDDQTERRVTGIRSTNTTKLTRTILMLTGQPMADIDDGIFATFLDFVETDITYPRGTPISFNIRNSSAVGLAVNTDAVVVRYEVAR
jgi:hypothetical protein